MRLTAGSVPGRTIAWNASASPQLERAWICSATFAGVDGVSDEMVFGCARETVTHVSGPYTLRFWRMGWDSNPRIACAIAGFQVRCIQPLCHPSVCIEALDSARGRAHLSTGQSAAAVREAAVREARIKSSPDSATLSRLVLDLG